MLSRRSRKFGCASAFAPVNRVGGASCSVRGWFEVRDERRYDPARKTEQRSDDTFTAQN